MAGRPAIRVEGLNELRRGLRRARDVEGKKQLVLTNRMLAQEVVARALPHVPVKSGRLKRSVRGLGNLSGAVGKAGGARVPYAPTIHWGRKRRGFVQRRPFLQNAAKSIERDIVDRYQSAVNRMLDAVRGK